MARALVIGGTAFMGREIVERLLDRDDDVVIMHRAQGTPFGDRVGELRCDRNDAAAVRKALAGERFDLVFDNVYDWQRGTPAEPVVAAAESVADGPQRYVFMSSIAAYGGGKDHDEHDELAPPDHPDAYMRHKAETERALFAMHERSGLPVATLRPAFVYGPHNFIDREAWFWDRIVANRPVIIPGDGSRQMQWVMARDVAGAALLAAANDVAIGSAYNIAGPPITQVEFVQACARAAGREAKLAYAPRAKIEAAGGSLFGPPLYFGIYLDVPTMTVRTERAHEELGLEPTPLDEGLRETFAWYLEQDRPRPDFAWEDALLAG